MKFAWIDIAVIALYFVVTLAVGMWVSKKAQANLRAYFLGGNTMPWYYLGLSNASGMFDISGTMWLVYLLFIYGLKSLFIPWVWPTFNQIFLMVFLSLWLRRSGVMTGAQWILFRFGESRGATLSHIIVVVFALCSVLGFLAYGFVGIGKFAAVFLPWQLHQDPHTNEMLYGLILTGLTTIYVVKGGMFSVVVTEVIQFIVMTIASVAIGVIAMQAVSGEMIQAAMPAGWDSLSPSWIIEIDWSQRLAEANRRIETDGYSMFGIFLMLVLFKGILVSLAGPAPNYDMQRILSARSPAEAAKMSGFVNVVLIFPRYMMIAGLTVLAMVFFVDELQSMGEHADFEQILPFALGTFLPAGLLGLVVAGLLASFMSTFAATTNAAPAYLVNDIYKRYINSTAKDAHYVKASVLVSLLFVCLGTAIGWFVPSLNTVILWLVSALWGGYTAANVFKWYWWRFNGNGYFASMLTGIVCAMPMMMIDINPLYGFPILFALCVLAGVTVSLLTPPDDMDVLTQFYQRTKPWGWWQPVITTIQHTSPGFRPNSAFYRDIGNVFVGVVWHTAMTAAPIFMVIKQWDAFVIAITLVVCTSVWLNVFWWNPLKREEEADSTAASTASLAAQGDLSSNQKRNVHA
ncbi:Na+:solute symporter [Aestuariibacter sp. AA17]|uniref:Na+:solute symporter n=1 Tax=Fluctibacter corallii TaxID=2984329 RepID=A0ABT3A762_9ALTE|nr:sodium:solute symporter family protein [Aestuariibacter sp. AA17]MCV2884520.1 Na+:solute symporter [Aestuariibacter sp. AA17]